MNKRSVVIDFLFVFFLTLIILISSFSTSYALSNNEARDRLKTYADNVSFSISNNVDFPEIETIYSNVIDLRVTVFDKEANVLLEINNDELEAAQEDRLNELVHYSNNTSFYILIIGSAIVLVIDIAYGFFKYRIYKKAITKLKENVENLEQIAGLNYDLSTDDGYKIIDKTLSQTSEVIKDQIDKLKSEKVKTDYILDSIEEGFIVLDGDNNCVLINKFALEKLGLNKEHTLGNSFRALALGDELNNGVLQAFRYNSSTFDKQIEGRIYQFLLTKIDLRWLDKKGKSGIGIIFFNVTEDRLNEKIRREFFQNASHELKTPLTTIIGYEEMIENGLIDDPKEIEKAREAVIKESKRMESVIEDMLALSSLEYNMSNEKRVDIDAKEMVNDIVYSFEYLLNEKEIDCRLKLSSVTLRMVPKDFDRLVRNLVSNAIKYNKEKGKISITLTKKYLSVKDTGIGIEAKNISRIFERFFRVDKGRSREQGGTGLGLAIVKHICLNYGFKVEVKSKVLEGTEFIVYFNVE